MLCEMCHQQPATVHLTTIVGGEKTEQHLCAACCQKHKQAMTMAGMSTLLLNLLSASKGEAQDEGKACPHCGQTYAAFRKSSLLGCAKCYETFRGEVMPMLERVHGKTRHVGRVPENKAREQDHQANRLAILRRDMERAVADEDFELAAQLRDEIRAMQPAQQAAAAPEQGEGGGLG